MAENGQDAEGYRAAHNRNGHLRNMTNKLCS